MKKILYIFIAWFLVLTSAVAWVSCADGQELPEQEPIDHYPIAFSSVAAEQEEMTRATTLGKDFVVYGYKNVASNQQTVFNGYVVKYAAGSANSSEDNTHGYYYVNPEINQFVKYWDYSATEYHYWGYVKNADAITPADGGQTLTISGLSVSITEPVNYLISTLKKVTKEDYNQVVQLRFVHPYAKVRVMVYSGEELEPAQGGKDGDAIELSQISFGPNGDNKIVKSATIKVSYPLTGTATETYSIQTPSYVDKFEYQGFDSSSSGSDKVLKLTSENCASNKAAIAYPIEAAAASPENAFYYVLPIGTGVAVNDYKFEVCVNGDDELKTAVVPAVYMQWKPNYSYTYIFKITEAGKKMSFYDVMVEPWHYGGSKDDTWTNW